MEWNDWAAISLSVIAILFSVSAELRSRKNQKVKDAEVERSKVKFECTKSQLRYGKYVELRFVNRGTETAINVRVDPTSALSVAMHGMTQKLRVEPNGLFGVSYIDPSGESDRLQVIALLWDSPGVGRQTITLPPVDDEDPPAADRSSGP